MIVVLPFIKDELVEANCEVTLVNKQCSLREKILNLTLNYVGMGYPDFLIVNSMNRFRKKMTKEIRIVNKYFILAK